MSEVPVGIARGFRSDELDGVITDVMDAALAIVDAAVIVADPDGRVLLWNVGAEELFGWSAVEAGGELARELIVPASGRDEAAEIRRSLAVGLPWSGSFLCRRRDGSILPVQVNDLPVIGPGGELAAIVAVCTDLTPSLEAERDGRALRAVTDGSSDAVLTVADRAIASWSPATRRLFGWTADEAIGQPIEIFVPEGRRAEAADILRRVERGESVNGLRTERLSKGGAPIRVEMDITPITDELTGRSIALVTLRDLRTRDEVLAAAHTAQARFSALLDRSAELVVVVDEDGYVRSTNPSNDVLAPNAEQPTIGHHIGTLVHPDDRCVVVDAHARALEGELHPTVVYRRLTVDGSVRWREATLTNLLDDEFIRGVVFNVSDVTEREAALEQMRTSEARLRAVVNRSSDVALFFEADGRIGWASPAIGEVFGYDPDEVIGWSGYDLVHPDDQARVLANVAGIMGRSGDHVRLEYRVLDGHGRVRWVEDVATNLLDDPDVGYIVANLRDITTRRAADDELRRLARFDNLTGLPNRNHLLELIERTEDAARCALIFLDLDDFCDVNDTLGHRLGDELLVGVSRRIAGVLPAGAHLARFEGDQFAVFCPAVDDLRQCLAVAKAVGDAFGAPFGIGGTEVFVAVSQGIALGPVLDADTLVSNADAALYRAKKAGRAQTVVFESSHGQQSAQRLQYVGEIRRAIEKDQIVPHFQPVVDLATGMVVAVEALARWHHAELGTLAPDEFIPVAESTGLIGDLGRSILRRSCVEAATWSAAGRRLQVAVNASAVQLVDPTFPAQVDEALVDSGLDPAQLTIEMTETAALRDFDAALRTLNALRDRGIGLSLDDFGTGYSSLAFLKRLPVGSIKIDRSFVSGLGTDEDDERIVVGVTKLALALRFHVVAEGVETGVQADRLRVIGCHFGQGYLWSPAVPSARLMDVISRIEGKRIDPQRPGGKPVR